eukprot:NODE_69_length_23719_cov_0.556689.p12 type:complete len:228 gc:universal NODE_69_length_23719_cov_0.556689:1083-400(-)
MDRQNRVGSKGASALARKDELQQNRKERLKKLALDSADLKSDPFFLKNHLGTFECKLCLTIHSNEGSYLIHTQGKKHQMNINRRSAKEAYLSTSVAGLGLFEKKAIAESRKPKKRFVKCGKPSYKITKIKDPESLKFGILIQAEFPKIKQGVEPLHRFMSSYEQRNEQADKSWQYLLIAAEPYETIAVKIPSQELDIEKVFNYYDPDEKIFIVQVMYDCGYDKLKVQ